MTFSSKQHIGSLDGSRGIAILLVFLVHYMPRNYYNPLSYVAGFGWAGVDLFFVLSGFLITGILYDTRNSPGFFKAFYARRALRLFPLYCLAVGIVIVGTNFLYGSRSWLNLPFFIYGANIVRLLPNVKTFFPPYFETSHFWSLALEEQFYSIWPLVVFFVPRRATLVRVCIVGIILAVALRIGLALVGAPVSISYFELPTRMDSLLAGALLALGVRGPLREQWLNPVRMKWLLAASSLALLAVIASARSLTYSSLPMRTVGYTAIAAISMCFLSLALVPGTTANRIGRNSILRFFGRYSYGLYVWHILPNPIVAKWSESFHRVIHPTILADMAYMLAMLALFTGLAVLSYHLFELYFLRLKSKFVAGPQSNAAALAVEV